MTAYHGGAAAPPAALVHEAYLKLVDHPAASFQDRSHFLSVAALAMRHILVDAARRHTAKKRGGEAVRITFDETAPDLAPRSAEVRAVEIRALDLALTSLAGLDERLSKLVELRFFGGLTEDEVADLMGISERTVRRDWRKA